MSHRVYSLFKVSLKDANIMSKGMLRKGKRTLSFFQKGEKESKDILEIGACSPKEALQSINGSD